jgi:hypothetical protein
MLAPAISDVGLQLRVLGVFSFCLLYGIFPFALFDLPEQCLIQIDVKPLRKSEQEEENIGQFVLDSSLIFGSVNNAIACSFD